MTLQFAPLARPALAAFIILGCTTSTGSGGGGGNAKCGATLSGKNWSSDCQTWVEQYCCTELSTCASSADCATLLACMDQCSGQDGCADTCAGRSQSSGITLYQSFASCTSNTPSSGAAIPAGCKWP